MGLFGNLFGKNRAVASQTNYISIDTSLGNVLLSGNSPLGKSSIFRNYAISVLNQGDGCIILREANTGFAAVPNVVSSQMSVYGVDISDGAFTEQFDPFAFLNEAQTVELLFSILNRYIEFEPTFKMKFKQYLSKMVHLLKISGHPIKLNELVRYNIEELEDINAHANIPEAEKSMTERFFDSVRQDISILESYFYDFSNNNVGFILSGNQSIESVLRSGKVFEISLDFSTRKEESELLLSLLTDRICKIDYNKANINSVAVFTDEIPNDTLMKAGFDKLLMTSGRCHMVYSIMDVASLVEKTNVFVDKADSLFFFQQQSNKNQDFCSEFFGTYEKQKISTTQTSGTSRGGNRSSAWDYWNGRGSSSRNWGNNQSTSYTTTQEQERIYLPNVFKDLAENQCIYFFRSDRSHNYLTVC
ncbi:MAG: hypothetical protein E7680_05485 [Ruminococcaceae bacterium]|nr:hypothetical protein [Oscillospiraceae bacterium]